MSSFDQEDLSKSTAHEDSGKTSLHQLSKKSLLLLVLVTSAAIYTIIFSSQQATKSLLHDNKLIQKSSRIEISIVILTYQKYDLLEKLLPTVINQKGTNFEIVIVDNGCLPDTIRVINEAFSKESATRSIPYKYLPLCDNPGYAVGNNKGVEVTSNEAEWLIFLNDDIVLQGEHFFKDMIDLGEMKPKAGGVVCKLLTAGAGEVLEAGSIVWKDGSAAGIGRGRIHAGDPDLSYAKPVDYGSGACLMMRKETFIDYEGFDYKNFPNYYEDTDIQLHIQHDLGLEVWFQPRSVALHNEHGSFSSSKATELMQGARVKFEKQWQKHLQDKHLPNPHDLPEHEKTLSIMRASDLRARDINKANILWFESAAPNKENGRGFGRTFDNLSMVAELGHRITLVPMQTISALSCNKECQDKITGLGVELRDDDWEKYVEENIEFFDIVFISRSNVFQNTYEKWQHFYKKHSFRLIYDCEGLWYKRDEVLLSLIKHEGISFPGGLKEFDMKNPESDSEDVELTIDQLGKLELSMLEMADAVTTVSQIDTQIVSEVTGDPESYTVGHVMDVDESNITKKSYRKRDGILFLGSYNNAMYHNGDAIWYFLTKIYPLVVRDAGYRIPLTIAGKQIPSELRDLVEKDPMMTGNVNFRESVPDRHELYNSARIFIAPHMYGSGVQYKVSEALSVGIPVVMSSFAADGFGIKPDDNVGCVGQDIQLFKKCILDIYDSEKRWKTLRQNGLDFIRKTYNRKNVTKVWEKIIEDNLNKIKEIRIEGDSKKMQHNLLTTEITLPTKICPEGEKLYAMRYPDIVDRLKAGRWETYFQHFEQKGKNEGRHYFCFLEDKS